VPPWLISPDASAIAWSRRIADVGDHGVVSASGVGSTARWSEPPALRQTSSYAIPPKGAAARWTRFLDRVHYRAPNGSPCRKRPITLGVLSPRPEVDDTPSCPHSHVWGPGRYVDNDVPAVLSIPLLAEDKSKRLSRWCIHRRRSGCITSKSRIQTKSTTRSRGGCATLRTPHPDQPASSRSRPRSLLT
jgi:hypothetical protein